jgi:hypothetical protein
LPSQKLLYKTLGIKPKVRGTKPFKRYTPGLFSQHLMCGVPQLNLILKVCTSFYPIDINSTELELIQLLLKVGAHPNVVDSNNYTPLHILATKESRNCRIWSYCISELHQQMFKNFTKTVEVFLDSKQHHQFHDHPNFDGLLAWKLLRRMQYPDPGLQCFLTTTLRKVPSLTCMAALIVRKHNIGYEDIPLFFSPL